MSKRPEISVHRQTAFSDDGQLEVTETNIETSLEDFGATVDHRTRDSRRDRPTVSQFGIDDRPKVEQSSESDQSTLFAETADDQQTLSGDNANTRCLYQE
ncbi:hypothetical protein ACFFQF_24395 [Haladaptatus pallidirubidus]|uniref:Uncharacterized protein n=1 Tax=Haladaptatus pallidirubidus TaxID=1008152 RepID=A0AAV3UH21_9EURY|nr:hypothetical protein [Haladaptatus pallidirubidus]